MKVRKAIQKIVALGTGGAMLGATMMGALAADLKDYPNPMFIGADGSFNGVLVVGVNAASSDVVGMTNIMGALQAAAVRNVPVSSGGADEIVVQGDSKKIERSTNKLELSESLRDTGITSLTSSDLEALKDSTFTNEFGTSTVVQTITLPEATSGKVWYTTDPNDETADDIPAPQVKFNSNEMAYKYVTQFTPALKSDHNTGSSGYLEDIRDKKVTLLGKEFTIQKADHTAANNIKLTLMGGARTITMEEGERRVVTLGDKEYDITADYIGSTTARFIVNSETTNALAESETHRLNDGTDLGVKTLLPQNLAEQGNGDKVEFYIGADKVEIEDANTSTSGVLATIKVNGKSLDNVKANIISTSDAGIAHGADVTISSLEVNYTPDTNLFVGEGETLSQAAESEEDASGQMFLNGFDFEFGGLQIGNTETISFDPAGSNAYRVKFKNKDGNELGMDIISYDASNTSVFLGELSGSTRRHIDTNSTVNLTEDAKYGIICDQTEYGYGYIVKFSGTNNADDVYKIKDMFSKETHEISYDGSGTGTLRLGGHDYTVQGDGDSASTVSVTDGCAYVYTELGAKISFNDVMAPGNTVHYVNITIESEDVENSSVARDLTWHQFYWDATGSKVQVHSVEGYIDTNLDINISTFPSGIKDGDTDTYKGYSARYGMFMEWDQPSSGQQKVKITYPDDQITAAFFVTSGSTTSGSTGTGGVTSQEVVDIPVSAVKLDSELADVRAQNTLVVGGPCVNSAAKNLMANPEPCAKDFQAGHAKIKLWEHDNGNVAMLVAGYSAMDTRRAAIVLTNYKDWATKLVGDEVDVTGTTLSDVSVGVPVVMEEPEVVDEEVVDDTGDDTI
ncbi:MAG: hypothetical protein ABIH34_00035 [Nanoarchaeota archaeon]